MKNATVRKKSDADEVVDCPYCPAVFSGTWRMQARGGHIKRRHPRKRLVPFIPFEQRNPGKSLVLLQEKMTTTPNNKTEEFPNTYSRVSKAIEEIDARLLYLRDEINKLALLKSEQEILKKQRILWSQLKEDLDRNQK